MYKSLLLLFENNKNKNNHYCHYINIIIEYANYCILILFIFDEKATEKVQMFLKFAEINVLQRLKGPSLERRFPFVN